MLSHRGKLFNVKHKYVIRQIDKLCNCMADVENIFKFKKSTLHKLHGLI